MVVDLELVIYSEKQKHEVNISSTNHRNFTFWRSCFVFSLSSFQVELTNVQDSVMALGKVTMSGRVVDENGILLSDLMVLCIRQCSINRLTIKHLVKMHHQF